MGVDDYHAPDEIYKSEVADEKELPIIPDLPIIDETDGECDFERVVSKLEVFVIQDQSLFTRTVDIAGVPTQFKHPSEIYSADEKWIDLRGDKTVYLKVCYDDLKSCKKPITDLNFYKISKY